MLLGVAMLEMGYIVRIGGIVNAACAIVALAALCGWTFLLVGKCLDKAEVLVPTEQRKGEKLDWPHIGQAAFGHSGKIAVMVVFAGDLVTLFLAMLAITGSVLQVVLPEVRRELLIVATGAMALVMTAIPEKYLGLVSSFGILGLLLFIVSLVISCASMEGIEEPVSGYTLSSMGGLPTVLSTTILGMMAHSEAATVIRPLEEKEALPAIVVGAFSVTACVCIMVGLLGYLAWGDSVQQNLLENIGLDSHGEAIESLACLQKLGAILFVGKMLTTLPIIVDPLASMVDAAVLSRWQHTAAPQAETIGHDGTTCEDVSSGEADGSAACGSSGAASKDEVPVSGPLKKEEHDEDNETASGSDETGLGTVKDVPSPSSSDLRSAHDGKQEEKKDGGFEDEVESKPEDNCIQLFSVLIRFATRFMYVSASVLCVVLVGDKLVAVTEVAGSSFALTTSITLPLLCYWKLHLESLSRRAQLGLGVALVLACIMQAWCIRKAFYDLLWSSMPTL